MRPARSRPRKRSGSPHPTSRSSASSTKSWPSRSAARTPITSVRPHCSTPRSCVLSGTSGRWSRRSASMRDIENFAPWGISESMKAERIWETIACEDSPIVALSRELGVSPVTARLLCIRGLGAPDDARRFLSPRIDDLHDPFRLAGMSIAVDRILGAIGSKDRIAIHGDYDVDGVTSTVILRRALELLGADVIHFIPERFRDGYGLQPATIDRLHQEGARLVVSVDCGIRADEAANHARELGIDLIITDHHEPGARSE